MENLEVAVVGGGLMGKGISQVFLEVTVPVTIIETNSALHEKIKQDIKAGIEKKIQKNLLSNYDISFLENHLQVTTAFDSLKDKPFIIEAVPEEENIKIEVYQKISEFSEEKAVLASNTSGLSIAKLSTGYKNNSQFIGMHFFYPVPLMNLVEIIPSVNTSEEVLTFIKEVCKRIQKDYVIANDYPGFIVNRLLIPLVNEAVYCVMEGEDIEDVDLAMRNGANFKMGPLTLADFVGLDVLYATMVGLYEGFNDAKYRPAPLLKRMVESGMKGRKNGYGFYIYGADGEMKKNTQLKGSR